jgi:hypothetical protein
MDIKEVFSYPTKDKEWIVKMIIGIALSILPIVNFFCSGYAYRIFKAALRGEALTMPEWDDWGSLFVNGFLIFAISFLYFIIPMILMGGGGVMLGCLVYLKNQGTPIGGTLFAVALTLLGVGFVLIVAACVVFPMALAVWAKNDERFGAAFRIWEIVPNIFKVFEEYLIAIVLIVAVLFAFFILCVIPYFGMLFAVGFSFYLTYLVNYALFGRACAGAFTGRSGEEKAAKE